MRFYVQLSEDTFNISDFTEEQASEPRSNSVSETMKSTVSDIKAKLSSVIDASILIVSTAHFSFHLFSLTLSVSLSVLPTPTLHPSLSPNVLLLSSSFNVEVQIITDTKRGSWAKIFSAGEQMYDGDTWHLLLWQLPRIHTQVKCWTRIGRSFLGISGWLKVFRFFGWLIFENAFTCVPVGCFFFFRHWH